MRGVFILCLMVLGLFPVRDAFAVREKDKVQITKWFIVDQDPIPQAVIDHEFKPTIEPEFRPVKYLKLEPPATLRHKIERLVFGIYTDVPPEYDYYGHRIRMFMAHVGGDVVMATENNLEGQLQNIKTAKTILREWRNEINLDVKAIEEEIEKNGAPSTERSLLKYNTKIVYGFIVDMSNWIAANQAVLEYLISLGPSQYTYENPIFSFVERKDVNAFRDLYVHRAEMHKILIDKYPTFRMMVY